MPLFTLVYRDKFSAHTDSLIEASNWDKAQEVGAAWCAREGHRFVAAKTLVVADESILEKKPDA